MSSPPPYNEGNFFKILGDATSGSISDASLARVHDALAIAAQPPTLDKMIQESKSLIKDGNAIGASLAQIQSMITKAKLPSEAQFKTHREEYTMLLWASRSAALAALGAVKEFGGDLMDFLLAHDATAQEKIDELDNTNNMIQGKGNEAAQLPRKFKSFQEQIETYARRVEAEISGVQTTERQELKTLLQQIDDIDKKADQLMNRVVSPITNFLKLGGGVFKSLLGGSPVTAFEALVSAIYAGAQELMHLRDGLTQTDRERRRLGLQRDGLKEKAMALVDKQASAGDISIVPNALRIIGEDVADFGSRLTRLTCVFEQLAQEHKDFVNYLKSGQLVTDPVFKSKVELVRQVLDGISYILDMYAKAPVS